MISILPPAPFTSKQLKRWTASCSFNSLLTRLINRALYYIDVYGLHWCQAHNLCPYLAIQSFSTLWIQFLMSSLLSMSCSLPTVWVMLLEGTWRCIWRPRSLFFSTVTFCIWQASLLPLEPLQTHWLSRADTQILSLTITKTKLHREDNNNNLCKDPNQRPKPST